MLLYSFCIIYLHYSFILLKFFYKSNYIFENKKFCQYKCIYHQVDLKILKNIKIKDSDYITVFIMAPKRGFEPPTYRLTAECSTIELLRNIFYIYYYINFYIFCNTFFNFFYKIFSIFLESYLLPYFKFFYISF